MIKISIDLLFDVKIQHKTINLLFCVVFASIKLPQHHIPKNNFRSNDTIFVFVFMLCHFVSLVKKSVTPDPLFRTRHEINFVFDSCKKCKLVP